MMKCSECGRPLTDWLSVAAGHGPTCSRHVLANSQSRAERARPPAKRFDPKDPANWRHLFDCCDRCTDADGELSLSYIPHAYDIWDSAFLYRCERGHRWKCWYNVEIAERSRFSDCPCDDCRECYGPEWCGAPA